jgi:hypothetical protein
MPSAAQRDSIRKRADWIVRSTEKDNAGTSYAGQVRKFDYGGDMKAPAHSLYNNVICWRALRDAGLVMRVQGDETAAAAFLRSAETLRRTRTASIGTTGSATSNRCSGPASVTSTC